MILDFLLVTFQHIT